MATILKADNLEKVYRIGKVDVPALRGVSLAIQEGEFVAVMGHRVAENQRCFICWAGF